MTKSLKEDQKGELDAPKSGVKEDNDGDRLAKVLFQLVRKIRWWGIKLAGGDGIIQVKAVLGELP